MTQRTALYDAHVALGAKIVDFAGWDMPLHYGSQIAEHQQVREDAGMFDVSHMTVVDITGEQAGDFLRHLLANNIGRLQQPGKALYSCMLNDNGGIIDDLITFFLSPSEYRIVVNAATRIKDLGWMQQQATAYQVQVSERSDTAMIAVQGPRARERTHQALSSASREIASQLGPFYGAYNDDMFISRTGYTGEDGYEIILPQQQAAALWQALLDAGVKPIGLGARDTLRLEAGMSLYGTDMDETTTPLESGLGWTVAWEPAERDFIGRSVLQHQRDQGLTQKFTGLILDQRGMLRNHQTVFNQAGETIGEITSGSFSPVLGKAIAFARINKDCTDTCYIDQRGKLLAVRLVKPPFVRNGKACVE